MSETSVSIDGVRSPILEFGPADVSEAVVFVHGNPGSILDWERLARGVGEFGRAVAMDMPGFGTADKPANFDYSVPGYAHHLGRLLSERGVRRAHLVMHDFGGPWGLGWAATNPHAVASVTCINTGVLSGYRWHYLARIWQTPVNIGGLSCGSREFRDGDRFTTAEKPQQRSIERGCRASTCGLTDTCDQPIGEISRCGIGAHGRCS